MPILGPVRIVKVPLGSRGYSIKIGSDLLDHLGQECARLQLGERCAIISDLHVAHHFAKRARHALSQAGFNPVLVTLLAGERAKSLKSVGACFDQLAGHRLERKSFIVALGGGVVGDLAGFVAATYLRGVPFVQVPTTLLAQVDSSVGGKVGINLRAGKNLVGAFHQPRLVLCDLAALSTLSDREFRSGLAEVIKYGIISDRAFFQRLERELSRVMARDAAILSAIIARCCEIKAHIVQQDETETGLRSILNFGHTIGHALEAISHYGQYRHGEAIAIGQVLAARLSHEILGLPSTDVSRICQLFERAGLPTEVKLDRRQRQNLMAAMRLDKKVTGGQIKFVLARRIGKVQFGQQVPNSLLEKVLTP